MIFSEFGLLGLNSIFGSKKPGKAPFFSMKVAEAARGVAQLGGDRAFCKECIDQGFVVRKAQKAVTKVRAATKAATEARAAAEKKSAAKAQSTLLCLPSELKDLIFIAAGLRARVALALLKTRICWKPEIDNFNCRQPCEIFVGTQNGAGDVHSLVEAMKVVQHLSVHKESVLATSHLLVKDCDCSVGTYHTTT